MKGINIKSCLRLGVGCIALTLGGCISLPNSPISPTPRFYMLSATGDHQISKKIDITSDLLVGIGPVKIPEYLNRPQMVTLSKEKMLQFAQFDRWGEPLDLGVARLIREDLTAMLSGAKLTLYPWNPLMVVKYQVVVEVVQLNSELDRDMFLVAQWTIIDVQNSKVMMIKKSKFRRPIMPQNYSGLVQTLSHECASLSGQIADTLGTLQAAK